VSPVAGRSRTVRVPASSGNLGPGYDVLGAALGIELVVRVSEGGEFGVDAGELPFPADRTNLVVRAFERLHPADSIAFEIGGEIPPARGLGSSAAAIVAGLLAADDLYELGNTRERIFELAREIEGHPDNVAAALFGGIAVCGDAADAARRSPPDPIELAAGTAPASALSMPTLLAPPEGLEAILVIPGEEVSTEAARAAMPAQVPVSDAVANVAAAAQLVLGIERSDLTLIERGLADRLHQPRRRPLYERSMAIVEAAPGLGAIGATISGAGPTVLVWSYWQSGARVLAGLEELCADWAEVVRVPFSPRGARVELT
jgi:homoserine kinase